MHAFKIDSELNSVTNFLIQIYPKSDLKILDPKSTYFIHASISKIACLELVLESNH